jgi:uncharacterized protein DUF4234
MAEEVQIAGTGSTAKIRHPLGVLGLSLVTLGIYFFFWWYFINREMSDLGRARDTDLGQNPRNSVLAITLGALIVVPAIVTMWTTSARIERAQMAVGIERPASGPVVFILLLLIGPVGIWYAQDQLNKVWRAPAASGPAPATLSATQPIAPSADRQAAPAESRPEAPGESPGAPPHPE